MKISTAELFPSVFNKDFKSVLNHEYTEYIEAGGRGSCKSSFISIVIIILIIQNKNYNALILRKTANSLRNSVFEQIKWAVNKLNLTSLFKFTLSPMQAQYLPTGQVILFNGVDDPSKLKSLKAKNGYFAITWFEESNEFTKEEQINIKLTTMRGGKDFYIFDSFNPPPSIRNWKNTDIRQKKDNRLVHITDYRTTPKEWLGEAFLFEAEQMKMHNERLYRNIFLGEATGTGRNVFENVELREITDEEINNFDYLFYGIDWGYYPDPFLWGAFSYDRKNRTLYIYDELVLRKHGNEEASKKLEEYLKAKNEDYNFMHNLIIADNAEPKSINDFRSYGWNVRACSKFPHSPEVCLKWLQSLFKIVIDPNRCPESADEFSLFEYDLDKRTGEIIGGFPQNQEDHAIAAARYALERIWQKKGE